MQKSNFELLTPPAFLQDVINEARKAKKRIWAQAMEVEPGPSVDTLLTVLTEGAERGLDSRLHADYYSVMVTDGTFNYWPFVSRTFRKDKKIRLKKKLAMVDMLREKGVHFRFTNAPTLMDRILPTRGRNHMKMVVIDNLSYIGGVNFHEDNFTSQDSMLKCTDPALTAEIAYVFSTLDRGENLRDMAIAVNDYDTLLIDGGDINRSLILRHTVEAVDRAENNVRIVTPLIPDADLLHALHRAQKRGIQLEIIAPRITHMIGIYSMVDAFNMFMATLHRISLPILLKSYAIHAKILIIDHREVIIGSHNLSSRGVRMGTEEIALQSTDTDLTKQTLHFFETLKERN